MDNVLKLDPPLDFNIVQIDNKMWFYDMTTQGRKHDRNVGI